MERNWILSDDLALDIMSRLPVRDLLRLRCVCKDWCALIDNASFIKKHYEVQYSICKVDGTMPYFFTESTYSGTDDVFLLSIHQGDAITLNLTAALERDSTGVLPYRPNEFYIDCHGCVNGVICLSFKYIKAPQIHNCFLALWNPATREFKTVLYPNLPGLLFGRLFGILGFGFDLSSSDFKILGLFDEDREDYWVRYYKLYSVKTNSWKTILDPNVVILPDAWTDGYLNGVYYMTTDDRQSLRRPSKFEIVSFNFASEVFKVSDLPQEAVSLVFVSNKQVMIGLYKEQLGLFVSHEVKEVALCNNDIWIVTQFDDCGVPLSWQHLYTIEATPDKLGLEVRSILMNGDLLLSFLIPEEGKSYEDLMNPSKLQFGLYNHSRCEFKKFKIFLTTCFRYVESLYSLS